MLVDAGFLVSSIRSCDKNHQACYAFFKNNSNVKWAIPVISGSVSLTNDHSTPLPVEVTNEININAMPEITGLVEVTNSRPMPVEVLNLSPIQVETR